MIDCASFKFSGHAIRRMLERQVMPYPVTEAVNNGEIIADYSQDTPYPSALIVGWATQDLCMSCWPRTHREYVKLSLLTGPIP